MTPEEITELRELVQDHAYDRMKPDQDSSVFEFIFLGNLLELALLERYLASFEDSLDDYEASWDASRTAPDGRVMPAWADVTPDMRADYIALELAQCVSAMMDRIGNAETGIHDCMPCAWEIDD